MKKINNSCVECNADYTIQHEMDPKVYIPTFCSFCGTEFPIDDDQFDYDGEYDEEYD